MLPTLFKLTTKGDIQTWAMEVVGGKYRSHTGKLDGKVVISAWTTCTPKNVGRSNETSPEDQAAAEAASQYELKRKKGYCDTVQEAKDSDRFQCMLAEKYKDRKAKLFDAKGCSTVGRLFYQPKLDGIRCIATSESLFSRETDRIVAVPHISEALVPLFEAQPDVIVDGELYNHDLKHDFPKIVSIVKKQKPDDEALALSREMAQYWVYDCVHPNREMCFGDRFNFIKGLLMDLPEHGTMITDVPTFEGLYESTLDQFYEQSLEEGFEGGMYRQDEPYQYKRTKYLLKRKEFEDAEFELIRIEDGEGGAENMAKVAYLKTKVGVEFKADIVGTHEQLRELWPMRGKLPGKLCTVTFQGYTPYGKPRFGKLKLVHMEGRW